MEEEKARRWESMWHSSRRTLSGQPLQAEDFDVPPVLAVEILSPSDTHEEVVTKIEMYLKFGVVVWVVDPDLRTVAVYRVDEPPVLFGVGQDLVGDPYLPGFRVAVSRLFAR